MDYRAPGAFDLRYTEGVQISPYMVLVHGRSFLNDLFSLLLPAARCYTGVL